MTPEKTVAGYTEAMHAWEVRARERNDEFRSGKAKYADVKRASLKEMEDIHQTFISKKVEMRGFRFANPPDYDPESEAILSTELVSKSSAKVHTQQSAGKKQTCIYHLELEDGSWRITDKFFVGHDGKPFRANL